MLELFGLESEVPAYIRGLSNALDVIIFYVVIYFGSKLFCRYSRKYAALRILDNIIVGGIQICIGLVIPISLAGYFFYEQRYIGAALILAAFLPIFAWWASYFKKLRREGQDDEAPVQSK